MEKLLSPHVEEQENTDAPQPAISAGQKSSPGQGNRVITQPREPLDHLAIFDLEI
jgi:hypothetical protein